MVKSNVSSSWVNTNSKTGSRHYLETLTTNPRMIFVNINSQYGLAYKGYTQYFENTRSPVEYFHSIRQNKLGGKVPASKIDLARDNGISKRQVERFIKKMDIATDGPGVLITPQEFKRLYEERLREGKARRMKNLKQFKNNPLLCVRLPSELQEK